MNSQYFDKKQIESGEFKQLLDFLMSEAYGPGKYYNDIHINPTDCGTFVVEWEQIPWDHSFGGHFAFIEEDGLVVKEKEFPDGHYELCYDDEDFKVRLAEFLKQNPYYKQNEYGRWYDEREQIKWNEELESEIK